MLFKLSINFFQLIISLTIFSKAENHLFKMSQRSRKIQTKEFGVLLFVKNTLMMPTFKTPTLFKAEHMHALQVIKKFS